MKKIILLAITCISLNSFGQKLKLGLKAGLNGATVKIEDNNTMGATVTPTSRASFHITGFTELKLNNTFSIQPGISVSGKGFHQVYNVTFTENNEYFNADMDAWMKVLYLEIPVNAIAKFQAGKGHFFIGTGPYGGFAVSGKTESKATITSNSFNEKQSQKQNLKFGSSETDDLRRFDMGLNFLTGYEFKNGFLLGLNYGAGLKNISAENTAHLTNKVFSISAGIIF
ncbi:porin family protein [Rubrolithibacter danxiaensis]|uniref:porin family protein n=1 Tax=Rubrolithibacter danxiaensis TaxID=3390805 RepID=UPI003BF920DD